MKPQRTLQPWTATLAATAFVGVAGLVVLGAATDGYRAFTSDAARAHLAATQRPSLPTLQLTDQTGRRFDLHEEFRASGAVWIVGFIYTRCRTLCSALTVQYRGLRHDIEDSGWQGRVRLLLVSFDPEVDRPAVLREHAQRFGLSGAGWALATPDSLMALRPTLARAGVTVLPLANGEFEHNAAFHLVTPDGRLSAIVPMNEPELALATAVDLARRGVGR